MIIYGLETARVCRGAEKHVVRNLQLVSQFSSQPLLLQGRMLKSVMLSYVMFGSCVCY